MIATPYLDDRGNLDVDAFQNDVVDWARLNFGQAIPESGWGTLERGGEAKLDPIDPLLGMLEELGELAHTVLKSRQQIREAGTNGDAFVRLAMEDAVGDLFVFAANFCAQNGIRLERAVIDTWAKVRERDWRQFPKNGVSE